MTKLYAVSFLIVRWVLLMLIGPTWTRTWILHFYRLLFGPTWVQPESGTMTALSSINNDQAPVSFWSSLLQDSIEIGRWISRTLQKVRRSKYAGAFRIPAKNPSFLFIFTALQWQTLDFFPCWICFFLLGTLLITCCCLHFYMRVLLRT